MKNLICFAFLVIVSCGCGQTDESHLDRITDWQAREKGCDPIETTCQISGDPLLDLANVVDQLYADYQKEKGNHWQTSQETIEKRHGDCEDLAILAFRAIQDSCLSTHYEIDVRIRIVGTDMDGISHVIAVVYIGDEFFEVDFLHSISNTERGSRVVAEFDLFNIY